MQNILYSHFNTHTFIFTMYMPIKSQHGISPEWAKNRQHEGAQCVHMLTGRALEPNWAGWAVLCSVQGGVRQSSPQVLSLSLAPHTGTAARKVDKPPPLYSSLHRWSYLHPSPILSRCHGVITFTIKIPLRKLCMLHSCSSTTLQDGIILLMFWFAGVM